MLSRAYAQVYQPDGCSGPRGAIALTVLASTSWATGCATRSDRSSAPMSVTDATLVLRCSRSTTCRSSFTAHKADGHASSTTCRSPSAPARRSGSSARAAPARPSVARDHAACSAANAHDRRGSVRFDGRELLGLSTRQLRSVRGNEIAMIFQDPMTSLNPAFTIGDQLTEACRRTARAARRRRRATRAIELLDLVGIPEPQRRVGEYPHQFSGGMRQRVMIAMALICRAEAAHRRRADHRARRDDPGPDPRPARSAAATSSGWRSSSSPTTSASSPTSATGSSVMYAGQVVEQAPVDEFFAPPRHPYSAGLLDSMPQSVTKGERLRMIAGTVPTPSRFPTGCRFHPRCPYAIDACTDGTARARTARRRARRALHPSRRSRDRRAAP